MKKIFEWMREQMKDRSEVCYRSWLKCRSDEDYGCSFAYSHAIDLVSEAEAKWEAEYNSCKGCVREDDENSFICNACSRLHGDEYEPIKISEVE